MSEIVNVIKNAIEGKIHQSAVSKTSTLRFQEEVVASCKMNYCGMYGKTWMCPPGVGNLEQLKEKCLKYQSFFVFSTKHGIEDSFDVEGMGRAKEEHRKIEQIVKEVLTSFDYRMLGAGGCNICEKCTYPDLPCRFPKEAISSIEANGINVVEMCSDLGINYINGQNTVTYFSLILY